MKCIGLCVSRPHRLWILSVALLILTMSALAQLQTGPSSFQAHGQAGRRVVVGNTGLGSSPSPVPAAQSWRLIGRPVGSQAVLDDPTSPQLSFVPDRQGTYVAEGMIPGGRPIRLVIEVGPGHTLAPVQLLGNGTGDIIVDGKTYPGPGNQGINFVLLNRSNLLPIQTSDRIGTVSAIKGYLDDALQKYGNEVLFLLTGAGSIGGNLSDLAPELEQLGGTTDFRGATSDYSFSFIGIKGIPSGQAYQVGASSLSGYFAPDSSGRYAFTQFDYRLFKINPSANLTDPSTIQVGDTPVVYSDVPPGLDYNSYSGGFTLAVFTADTLSKVFSQTYATFANTPDVSIAQQKALAAKLAEFQGSAGTGNIVCLTTFGQAHNGYAPMSADFGRLAQQIDKMGGTYDAVYPMDTGDTYSLVTYPDPVTSIMYGREAGTRISSSKNSGVLQGALARGRQGNWYRPVASAGDGSNLALYQILGTSPQPWPHPASGDTNEQNAYKYISNQLVTGLDDVRQQYANTNNLLDPSAAKNTLSQMKDGSTDCGTVQNPVQTPFCNVRNQLLLEMGYLTTVRAFNVNLDTVTVGAEATFGPNLTGAVETLNSALKPPPQSQTLSIAENVINTVLTIGWAVGGEVAGPFFGILSGAFTFGTGLANELSGSSAVVDISSNVENLAKDETDRFNKLFATRGVMFDAIYEDWGKFSAIGQALANPQDPNWYWNGDFTTGQGLITMERVRNISIYRALLPAAYVVRIWNAQDSKAEQPADYEYRSYLAGAYWPIFLNYTYNAYINPLSPRVDLKTEQFERDILFLTQPGGLPSGPETTYLSPSDTILSYVYDPNQGLGVWKPDVFRHWPFQRFYCMAPRGYYDDGKSNCEQKTPQLPQ